MLRYCASLAACLVSLYCAVAGLAGGAFGVVSLYSAHNGQSAPRIGGRVAAGGVSARVGVSFVAGGAAYPPHPTPKTSAPKSGCLLEKFFYFFIFLFLHHHHSSASRSRFVFLLAFFRVKCQKSHIFLMLQLELVDEMRNLGILGHF